jgi:hypothetical protein
LIGIRVVARRHLEYGHILIFSQYDAAQGRHWDCEYLYLKYENYIFNTDTMSVTTKVCRKCEIEQLTANFSKNARNKDGLDIACRACHKKKYDDNRDKNLESQRKWREKNPEYQKEWVKDNERNKEYHKQYYQENRDAYLKRKQDWRKNNPELAAKAGQKYRENNRDKSNAYHRQWKQKKRNEDEQYKLKENTSRRIRSELNDYLNIGKTKTTTNYIGCTVAFLKTYIEGHFTSEMSWGNYGNVWEIDHIIPCKAWDVTDAFQSFCCWNYRNLRPLKVADNRAKKHYYQEQDKIDYMEVCSMLYKVQQYPL